MITIHGDKGEGGGAVIRLSVALSAITGKPIRIINIRAKRCVPGLREQHKKAVMAVASLCGAKTENVEIGSSDITFIPGNSWKRQVKVRIGTAGSVGLVLQSLMPACFASGKNVKIEIEGGGTIGLWSPNLLYIKHILFPAIAKMGFHAEMNILRHGFFPKGEAIVKVRTKAPSSYNEINIKERGNLLCVKGVSLSSESLKKRMVSERMKKSAKQLLEKNLSCPLKIRSEYAESSSSGCGILLWSEFENCSIAWDAIGEIGKRAEEVGRYAAEGLLHQLLGNGTVDDYLSDQLLIYMAMAGSGSFKVNRITGHAETNMKIIEKFLPVKFNVDKNTISVTKNKKIENKKIKS